MSQSDSDRCRASRSSLRAVEYCGLAMGRYMMVSSAKSFKVELFLI